MHGHVAQSRGRLAADHHAAGTHRDDVRRTDFFSATVKSPLRKSIASCRRPRRPHFEEPPVMMIDHPQTGFIQLWSLKKDET